MIRKRTFFFTACLFYLWGMPQQALAAKTGLEIQTNYIYSFLEATTPAAAKFNFVSTVGAQVQAELSQFYGSFFEVYILVGIMMEDLAANSITVEGHKFSPFTAALGGRLEFRRALTLYLQVSQEDLPIAKYISDTQFQIKKVAFQGATAGLRIAARTRFYFSTIIDLHLEYGLSEPPPVEGKLTTFNYGLGGFNRFEFGKAKQSYGLILGFETRDYKVKDFVSSRYSHAMGGLYLSYVF